MTIIEKICVVEADTTPPMEDLHTANETGNTLVVTQPATGVETPPNTANVMDALITEMIVRFASC